MNPQSCQADDFFYIVNKWQVSKIFTKSDMIYCEPALLAISFYGLQDGLFTQDALLAMTIGGTMTAKFKKLTLQVPNDLLTRAMQVTGKGITSTIRRGLELVAASGAYRNLRALKGKVKLELDLEALRQDQ